MQTVTDDEFDGLITKALDSLPQKYIKNMNNVAIVIADEPTSEQRQQLKLRCNQTLFGLYQGVSLPERGGRPSMIPDKITIFKQPIVTASHNPQELLEQVRHTLWHEIAHHFGLNHEQIHKLESHVP
jgi:predicted Zn-dependent protease with MMP-like domain